MKSQSNTAQTTTQEEPAGLGAPSTSTALSILFEAAADNLAQGEFEYLARMDEHAALQTHSLSEALMTLGSLYCNADKLDQPSAQSTAEIFWNLSNQLDHITGLIELAGSKAYRLANPKTEANKKGRCVMGMQNNSVGSSDLRNIMKLGYAVNTGSHCGGYYWQILTDADGLDELENALNNIDAWVADSQAAIGFLLGSADLGDAPATVIQDIDFLISGLSELQQAVHCANDVVRANALRAITQKANQQT